MSDILEEIVNLKRRELENLKLVTPISELEHRIEKQATPLNFAGALWGDSVRVIAEIKKASPTKGLLRPVFDPMSLATTYVDNGAAAISVLTNKTHFQGDIGHLADVHNTVNSRGIPVLRKEFIFDPYQVYEARAFGADAILLIVAILSPRRLKELLSLAQQFWMHCLVEVHDEEELKTALNVGVEIVGINNRDLQTFDVDLEVTHRLAPLIPNDKIIVSESGISNRNQIQEVKRSGIHAVLIGEALLSSPDAGAKLRELL